MVLSSSWSYTYSSFFSWLTPIQSLVVRCKFISSVQQNIKQGGSLNFNIKEDYLKAAD
jgi:hypothetical protein